MHAVITAGGRVDGAFAEAIGSPWKALAPLGTGRLIDVAIAAARATGVEGIAVIAPDEVARHCASRVDLIVEAADDGVENIRRALYAFPQARRLVYLTSDLPFVEAAGLADFIERSAAFDLTMALADENAYAQAFPGAPMHVVDLGGERIANGSAFVIDTRALAQLETVAGRFFTARKSLVRLALLLGPTLCLRFAFKRLRLADIETRARAILGVDARAIRASAPGLCLDIDSIDDWAYAHALALRDA